MAGNIIFREKQARILLLLKSTAQPWNITTIAKASGTTYVHACNFMKSCEQLGIVTHEKHGKIKEIKLTEKGVQVAEMVSNIYAALALLQTVPPEPQEKK